MTETERTKRCPKRHFLKFFELASTLWSKGGVELLPTVVICTGCCIIAEKTSLLAPRGRPGFRLAHNKTVHIETQWYRTSVLC